MALLTNIAGPPFPVVAVLDTDGSIAWVSEEWRQFERLADAGGVNSIPNAGATPSTRTRVPPYTDQIAAAIRDLRAADDAPTVRYDAGDVLGDETCLRLSVTTARIAGATRGLIVYRRLPGDEVEDRAATEFPGDVHTRPANRLVTYTLDPNETAIDGLLAAFDAIGVDAQNRDTTLQDCLATDPINSMYRLSDEFHLTVSVWDHEVVLTSEALSIYATDAE